jgi:hypothetical protein
MPGKGRPVAAVTRNQSSAVTAAAMAPKSNAPRSLFGPAWRCSMPCPHPGQTSNPRNK